MCSYPKHNLGFPHLKLMRETISSSRILEFLLFSKYLVTEYLDKVKSDLEINMCFQIEAMKIHDKFKFCHTMFTEIPLGKSTNDKDIRPSLYVVPLPCRTKYNLVRLKLGKCSD